MHKAVQEKVTWSEWQLQQESNLQQNSNKCYITFENSTRTTSEPWKS